LVVLLVKVKGVAALVVLRFSALSLLLPLLFSLLVLVLLLNTEHVNAPVRLLPPFTFLLDKCDDDDDEDDDDDDAVANLILILVVVVSLLAPPR